MDNNFKERVKYKVIISLFICLISFMVIIHSPASYVLLGFSIYYLFNAIVSKSIVIDEEQNIKLSYIFRRETLKSSDIISIKRIRTRLQLPQYLYLGILYLLLDYTMDELSITTTEREYRISLKYFEEDLYEYLRKTFGDKIVS